MPKTDSNLTSQIPKRVKNMTGQRFTRLLVIGYAGQFHNRAFWYCVCDCKSFVKVEGIKLRGGHSKSCGCERINVNGNYEPDNCKWLLRSLQARNKRNNHFLTVNGETLCIAEWAERLNNNPSARTIWKRNRRGWSDGEALGFIQRTKNR